MITTVDVETSYQKTENGGYDASPFHEDNILVSVGLNSYFGDEYYFCLLYTSPSPRDMRRSRMPSSA